MSTPKRHDHRQSFWAVSGHLWCYQCGAVRFSLLIDGKTRNRWIKPTGIGGPNPASTK